MPNQSDPEKRVEEKRRDNAKRNQTNLFFPFDLFDSDASMGKAIVFGVYDYSKPTPNAREIKNARRTIALPIPPELSEEHGLNYNEFDGGFSAREIRQLGRAGDVLGQYSGIMNGNMPDSFDEGKGLLKDAGLNILYSMGSRLLGDEFSLFSSFQGKTVNPYNQAVFQSVSLRQHQFNYMFKARNPDESRRIFNICETFKEESYPTMQSDYALKFPSVFEFKFYPDSIDRWLFQPNVCALTAVSVGYSGETHPKFYAGTGAPIEIGLSLEFQELVFDTRETLREKRDKKAES